jgi:hypothetical protein
VREAARFESFPDDYELLGSIGFQQQRAAIVVLPLLAEATARSVLRTDRKSAQPNGLQAHKASHRAHEAGRGIALALCWLISSVGGHPRYRVDA